MSETTVRRRQAAKAEAPVVSGWDDDERDRSGPVDDSRSDDAGGEDDGDNKSAKLTLMEEVLLLGLKDKEVSCH